MNHPLPLLLRLTAFSSILLVSSACRTPSGPGGAPAAAPASPQEGEARAFLADHEISVRPLEKALALAWWEANTLGTDDAFKGKEEAQNLLDAALSDPARFTGLKAIREALKAAPKPDPLVVRQMDLLYLQYLEKQVDPELLKRISAKANAIEQAFNVYRARVGDRELSDREVRKVLKESKDPAYRKAVWEANKCVGAAVEKDLRALVTVRNEAARKLGFKDFHAMTLALNEQSQEAVLKLLDELHDLTREPFREVKARIDEKLAKDYGIAREDLRPWHYNDPFFQEAPLVSGKSFDPVYATQDIPGLARQFYAGIGLPVDGILERSDLFERKGKSPHAFSTDIDRAGDSRILANIVPTEYWMATTLHELGHAVYTSLNIPPAVPYVLRMEAHPVTTEGIAMMFEQFAKSPAWLEAMGIKVPDREALEAAGRDLQRSQLLIFAAWVQVMFRFEMGMYGNPDQDLNKLWWDLVETYQLIRRPEGRSAPDYGAKLHIVSAPCYYHNYQMGQFFASQVHHAIAREVLKTGPATALYVGRKDVGDWLKTKVFTPGRTFDWNALTKAATGEDLSAKSFAEDLKDR